MGKCKICTALVVLLVLLCLYLHPVTASCLLLGKAQVQFAVFYQLLLLLFECSLPSFKLNVGFAFWCTSSELNAVL